MTRHGSFFINADITIMDLRVLFSSPSQKVGFDLAQSDVSIATRRNPDKAQLRTTVLKLRDQGMSYREIAHEVGLHWTRIQQIVRTGEISAPEI